MTEPVFEFVFWCPVCAKIRERVGVMPTNLPTCTECLLVRGKTTKLKLLWGDSVGWESDEPSVIRRTLSTRDSSS